MLFICYIFINITQVKFCDFYLFTLIRYLYVCIELEKSINSIAIDLLKFQHGGKENHTQKFIN